MKNDLTKELERLGYNNDEEETSEIYDDLEGLITECEDIDSETRGKIVYEFAEQYSIRYLTDQLYTYVTQELERRNN